MCQAEKAEEEHDDDSTDENDDHDKGEKRIVDRAHQRVTRRDEDGEEEEGTGEGTKNRKEEISISSQREMLTQSKNLMQSMIPPSSSVTRAKESFGHSLTAGSLEPCASSASSLTPSFRSPTSRLPKAPETAAEMGSKSIQVKLLNEETESIIKAIRSELLKFQSNDDPVPPNLQSVFKGQKSAQETNIVRHSHSRQYPSGSRESDHSINVTTRLQQLPRGLSVFEPQRRPVKEVELDDESRLHYV